MTLIDYAKTLRRNWALIAVLTILGFSVGYLSAAGQTAVYQTSSSVLVTSELGNSGSDLVQGSTYVENLVASYVNLATSEKVLQPVIDDLGLDTTPRALAGSVSASTPLNTVLINITVRGSDPQQDARLADAVTESFSTVVSDVSPRVEGKPAIRLTTIQSANVPSVPVAPNKRRLTALGGIVGLALGVAVALIRRSWGSKITDVSDVVKVTDLPVVGEIVKARRGSTLPATVLRNPLGVEAESLRALAANLSFLSADEGLRSIVVTSATPRESKSSIASSAALTLAEASNRVLLIDADLRSPSLHTFTNLDNSIGLSTVLLGEDSLEYAVLPWGPEGLDVLTSGPIPPNPGQLLNSEAMGELIERAKLTYDTIVIDSAPLLRVVDAVWLGHLAEGVLVVVRRGKTSPRSLRRALDTLASANTAVSGIVISCASRGSRPAYTYTAAD